MLDKAMRELDRERMGLQNQEKKLIAEIKKMAKEGQLVSSRHLMQRCSVCCCSVTSALPAVTSRPHAIGGWPGQRLCTVLAGVIMQCVHQPLALHACYC